jgi:hypothetical protein
MTFDVGQPDSAMEQEGEERRLPISLTTPSCFFISISSFFSAIGKEAEERWDIMWEDVGCAGMITHFIAPQCNNRGGEAAGLHRRGKKVR